MLVTLYVVTYELCIVYLQIDEVFWFKFIENDPEYVGSKPRVYYGWKFNNINF